MSEQTFTCSQCGSTFTLDQEVLDRYPGWTPRICLPCKDRGSKGAPAKSALRGVSGEHTSRAARRPKSRPPKKKAAEENLRTHQVLERYTEGPADGVFTDGACTGNPGPGGWGVVWVEDGEIVKQQRGHDPDTTNNRMELAALIHAYEMLPEDARVTIWSDSNLCVRTINEWAAGWQRRGWKRKTGPIKNLELVQRAYRLALRHRGAKLRWIKAHDGSRWNEYADSLATAYLRDEL